MLIAPLFLTELPMYFFAELGTKWAIQCRHHRVFSKQLKKAELSVVNK